MIEAHAEGDKKMKGMLKNAAYAIYGECEEQEKDLLEQAKTNGMFSMSCNDGKDQKQLVEVIPGIIAK